MAFACTDVFSLLLFYFEVETHPMPTIFICICTFLYKVLVRTCLQKTLLLVLYNHFCCQNHTHVLSLSILLLMLRWFILLFLGQRMISEILPWDRKSYLTHVSLPRLSRDGCTLVALELKRMFVK